MKMRVPATLCLAGEPYQRSKMLSIINSWQQLLTLNALLIILYMIWGVIYRLYLCPVAKFPGPRWAAVTFWYEFYYDVVKRGKYVFKIRELHKHYGIEFLLHSSF